MNFAWEPEQDDLYTRVLSFSEKSLNRDLEVRLGDGRFPRDEWRECGRFGLLGLCVPEEYGGLGQSSLTTAHAMEAFGKGCEDAGLCFSVAAHLFAGVMPICDHAGPALKDALLPPLARGERIAANAITEPEAGSDVFALKCRAEKDGDHYVLNGTKSYVTNGPVADVFVVYASTNPAHGYMGISAFAVPRDTPGLTVGPRFSTMGLHTSPIGSIYLDGCRVPESHRIGDEGQGATIFTRSMHWERSCLFAIYVGQMERFLERTIAYATQRKQFKKAISRHQAVAHRIVDMKVRLESARWLLYRACWLRDQGKQATLEVALAKLAVSEAAIQSGLDAIRIHGGIGVVPETGIERALRDAIPSAIFSGTSEIQKDLIARELGL